eukprot:6187122-Pleurochrysis_carterae.AAC.3
MERTFDQLHAHSSRGVGPSRGAFVCEPSQPQWRRDSKGLVLRHADWRYCYFKQVAYCRSELFQKAANVTPTEPSTHDKSTEMVLEPVVCLDWHFGVSRLLSTSPVWYRRPIRGFQPLQRPEAMKSSGGCC